MIDSQNMLGAVAGLPEQIQEAYRLGLEADLPGEKEIKNIVVAGLGGSAIGGDLLRVYAGDKSDIPVNVVRDYILPRYVNKNSLVIATSYSGNTEETLHTFAEAKRRGASIVVITSGGKLAEEAGQSRIPAIIIPSGISPRAATGFLFIPAVVLLNRLGLAGGAEADIKETVGILKLLRDELSGDVPAEKNSAKQIASFFKDGIPIIWGASGTSEVVAQRWKGQINENAKSPAYWNVFPELNHNEIVGFEAPGELLPKLRVVILRDENDHPQVKKRMDITKSIIKGAGVGVQEVLSRGKSYMARVYSLIYPGDYASIYLACYYDIDPGPVKMIDHLKQELAR
ncbi:MAG TPA: bifunctional phosphoglucose/phosphomannose isomerase [Clostridia bacterium]|nr:bifunctional phosphoglucose/phosphomannose isomerase [Clostridia bacterium]